MKRLLLAVLFLVAFPVHLWAASAAPTTTYSALLSGKIVPLTVKFKSLDSTWRRFSPTGAQDQSSIFSAVYGLAGGTAHYTTGRTVSVGGEVYLVAYSAALKTDMSAIVAARSGRRAPEPLTADSLLQLSLLNVRSMGSMTNIKPFDLKAELAAFAEASANIDEMMSPPEGVEEVPPSNTNLKQVALALEMYATDYEAFPAMDNPDAVRAALGDYVSDEKVFKDDSDTYFAFNASLAGKSASDVTILGTTVIAYQAAPGKDGKRQVALGDGSVKPVTEEEWKKLAADSGIQ